MFAESSLAIAVVVVLAAGVLNAGSVGAQTDSAAMEASLKAQYKLATIKIDNGALSIVQPGVVLVIQEDGILGVPPSESNVTLTTFKVQEGVRQPGTASRISRLLRAGDKVYVTNIGVDSANDSVSLTIVECDACNNVQKPSSLVSRLVFELPKGYLQMADASQVSDAINEVLLPEAAASATTASTPPEPANPAPAATSTAFSVQHRHLNLLGSGSEAYYYCSGDLTILPDGTVKYDCTQTDDPSGRCDHVSIPGGYLKQAKVGYNGALHLASKGQGNFDFFGDPGTLKDALAAITPLIGTASTASTRTIAPPPKPPANNCGDYESCMKKGEASLEQSNGGSEALEEFEKASQLEPSKGEPVAGKGYAYLEMGQYDNAIYMWDGALKLGATLSSPVCHAGMACGDTGEFLLSMKEVSFVNKKGEKKFSAPPSAITSDVGTPTVIGGKGRIAAYYIQLVSSGKNYRFYYSPKALQCRSNFLCPEPGLTQQKVFADYVHGALVRMAAGDLGSPPSKP
jgi:tetratricopeptide (TPR) repeat protein